MAPIKDPVTGKDLGDVIDGMIAAAIRNNKRVFYTFNGVTLFADPGTKPQELVTQYESGYYYQGLEAALSSPPSSTTPSDFAQVGNWEHKLTAGV